MAIQSTYNETDEFFHYLTFHVLVFNSIIYFHPSDSRRQREDRCLEQEGAGTLLRRDRTTADFHIGDQLREDSIPRRQLH